MNARDCTLQNVTGGRFPFGPKFLRRTAPVSRDVLDFNIAPFLLQVFSNQATMAVVRLFLAAEKTACVKHLTCGGVLYVPGAHQSEELVFVQIPIAPLLSIKPMVKIGSLLDWPESGDGSTPLASSDRAPAQNRAHNRLSG
jgi:hypothetical protein